jgi:hypothetical protein
MVADVWVHGAIVSLAVAQLVVVVYLYRRSALADAWEGTQWADGSGRGGADISVVVCPECDARNETEFQFCRNCAAELPGPTATSGLVGGAQGSGMR